MHERKLDRREPIAVIRERTAAPATTPDQAFPSPKKDACWLCPVIRALPLRIARTGRGLGRLGPDLGHGSGDVPAIEVVRGGAGEGVSRDRQRVSNVTGIDRHRDRHPHVVGTPAMLGGKLGPSDGKAGRISQSTLEAATDTCPGTPAAAARHRQLHPVPRRPPGGRPPRHAFMITYRR